MAAFLYWKHFGLNSAPFPVTPSDDAFYSGGTRKATVDATLHVLRNERGIVKVVGEPGTGKTTLCRQITRELRDRHTVVYTCDPSLGGDQTWYALADALQGLLDEPYGCPLCDCGRPRNPAKGHMDYCPYEIARAVLAESAREG